MLMKPEINVRESVSRLNGANNSMIPVVKARLWLGGEKYTYSFPILGGDVVRFPESLSYPGCDYYDEILDAVKKERWTPYRHSRHE